MRLKAGQRYALVGRNGTGKSTLLRAVAEKLIPGIPEETRIAILQQTRLRGRGDGGDDQERNTGSASAARDPSSAPVLEEVVSQATARHLVECEIKGTKPPCLSLPEFPASHQCAQLSPTA